MIRPWLVLAALTLSALALSGCSSLPLSAGTTSAPSSHEASDAVAGVRTAVIDGIASGHTWLRATGGSIEASGYIGGEGWTVRTSSGPQPGVEFLIPEAVGALTLYHSIPIYLPSTATVTIDGTRVDPKSLLQDPDLAGGVGKVKFRLESDRPTVESLVLSTDENQPADLPQGGAPGPSVAAADPGSPWLSIRQGGTARLTGYSGGMSSTSGTGIPTNSYAYYYVVDRLGTATIFHIVPVSTSTPPPDASGPVSFTVLLRGTEFLPAK